MAKKANGVTRTSSSGVTHRGYTTSKVFVPKSLPTGPAPGAKRTVAASKATGKAK